MPYKASARPFFFPAAGRRSAIAAFHSEMFPLFLRGITLSAGRRSIPDTRRAVSVSADPTAAIRPRPGHRTHGPFPRAHRRGYNITAIHTVTTPAVVLNGHNLHIRTVPVRARTENGHPKYPHGNALPSPTNARASPSTERRTASSPLPGKKRQPVASNEPLRQALRRS